MPITCQHKTAHGHHVCVSDCPANVPCGIYEYRTVDAEHPLPPADERIIDIAVMDMNHGWPNLGHDSLVHLVQDASCDILDTLQKTGLSLRVFSFDVRRTSILPEKPGGRFALYLGTGGPGHIDPRLNDGVLEGSQGIVEDASWEEPLFELFDAIRDSKDAVLLGVCHTFGVMCSWSGIAAPVLRGAKKGGKSTGALENLLTPEAKRHPWFRHFSEHLPDGSRLRILDNRLFDLIPDGQLPEPLIPIGHETLGVGGSRGDAITMVEWARDRNGVIPRIFASNHHPEIVDRSRQLLILERKRNEVSRTWYEERLDILTRTYPDEDSEYLLALTSDFTIVAPLRYHLFRQVRERAQALGFSVAMHEEEVIEPFLSSRVAGR
jgi:hypothetical protein